MYKLKYFTKQNKNPTTTTTTKINEKKNETSLRTHWKTTERNGLNRKNNNKHTSSIQQ